MLALCAQAAGAGITQRQINEYAAACLTTRTALSGLKAARRQGESPPQYQARLQSYLLAVARLRKELRPLKSASEPDCRTPDNILRWRSIMRDVQRLDSESAEAQKAYGEIGRQGDRGQLGPRLLAILTTVESTLNGLRQLRP